MPASTGMATSCAGFPYRSTNTMLGALPNGKPAMPAPGCWNRMKVSSSALDTSIRIGCALRTILAPLTDSPVTNSRRNRPAVTGARSLNKPIPSTRAKEAVPASIPPPLSKQARAYGSQAVRFCSRAWTTRLLLVAVTSLPRLRNRKLTCSGGRICPAVTFGGT
eukprot:3873340-Rhodomonas_salina.1